jgi:hypothetical protein
VGENSVVGVATAYGQDGLGFELRYGKKFPSHYETDTGAYSASFPGIMRPERGVERPLHLDSTLKKE